MQTDAIAGRSEPIEDDAYRVLLTGFGPSAMYPISPSWLAVQPLHDTTFYVDPPPPSSSSDDANAMQVDDDNAEPKGMRQVHITASVIPVLYDAVMTGVPLLHARPPVLPLPDDAGTPYVPPPERGYDLIFHVGVAGRGALRLEKLAHKSGYHMKDAAGALAPIVEKKEGEFAVNPMRAAADAVDLEMGERLGENGPGTGLPPPTRGFSKGYESFTDEELKTDIPVDAIVAHLKAAGMDRVYSSMDAGHYLSDFVYWCSLAETKRTQSRFEGSKTVAATKVLFMHCPPAGLPIPTAEVAAAIIEIIKCVTALPPPSAQGSPPSLAAPTMQPAPRLGPLP